ncbi:hypothetical protein MMC21_008351 [Puttea exsequens]|nr:hypothetical protein [Puttea exsequens]
MKKFVKCRSFCIDGCYKDEQHDGLLELSDVVEIVLSIVAYTGLGIKSFVLDPQMKSTSRLDTERLQIPPHCTPQFKAAWEHLEELVLECSLIQAQEAWLLALLSHASRLRNLSLGFSTKASDSDFGGSFIERLTTVYPFRGLQEIEMYHATVPAETLLNFLLRSRDTLRILVLRLATIKAGGSWNKFLESMRAEFPRLESLALHMPRQQTQRGHNGFKVMFPKLAENPRFPGSEEREFNGSNLIFDSRLVKPLARPVNLTCACQAGKTKVVSARYQGPDIDAFLSIIAATVETSTEA